MILENFELDNEVDMFMDTEAEELSAAAEDMVMSNSTDIDIIGGITDEDIPEYDPTEDEYGIDDEEDVIEYHYETDDTDNNMMDDIEDAIDNIEDDDDDDEEDETDDEEW